MLASAVRQSKVGRNIEIFIPFFTVIQVSYII